MRNRTKPQRIRLTNAAKRRRVTLGSAMSIRIPFDGRYIECSTAEEAIAVLKHLAAESGKIITRVETNPLALGSVISQVFGDRVHTSAWTRELFQEFIENLGDAPVQVLSVLVRQRKATDEELRKVLGVDTNQALAGVLSGISKQAGALNVPARAVYTVEDERKSGALTKTYAVAGDFLRMASDQNWPPE
jgi:hypothetical protein